MQKFTRVTGTAAPLMKDNIDTDVIIPAKRLVGHLSSGCSGGLSGRQPYPAPHGIDACATLTYVR